LEFGAWSLEFTQVGGFPQLESEIELIERKMFLLLYCSQLNSTNYDYN